MSFLPYRGKFDHHECGWLGSSAIVYAALVRFDIDTGYIEPGSVTGDITGDATIYGVNLGATQTASSTNGATKTMIIPFNDTQIWVVDTTGTPLQTQVGTLVSLTDAVSIDEDDTGNWPTFYIVGFLGALSAKKALVKPCIMDSKPDATALASGIVAIGYDTP